MSGSIERLDADRVPAPQSLQEPLLTFSERLQEIRTGFERPFWVANISEIFERLSYYAAFASLARYLHETLQFPTSTRASSSDRTVRRAGLVPGRSSAARWPTAWAFGARFRSLT